MQPIGGHRQLATTALLALWLAWPASADWLVLHDGTRVETEGPWRVKGRQVVFTAPGGALSALRVADVDLDASDAATREAKGEESAGATSESATVDSAPSRRPVRTITNDNLSRRPDDGESEALPDVLPDDEGDDSVEEAAYPDSGSAPAAGVPEPVEIVSWNTRETDDGLELSGSLRNAGDDFAVGIQLDISVAGFEDQPPVNTQAFLGSRALAPGARTSFRVVLDGIFFLPADPTFDLVSEAFGVTPPPPPADEEEDEFGDDFDDFDDG